VCKKIVEMSIEKFGKISVLVNSAGVLKTGTLENMKMEDYEDSMEINVKSIIHLTQLCLPYLIAEKGKLKFKIF
jgi:NADP-dependent 3-hydroxy acid dehydrogenase YdfG